MENKFKLDETDVRNFEGGTIAVASKLNFHALEKLAIQSIKLQPSGLREPHVHPNAAQLDYCISGKAQIGIIGGDGIKQLFDLNPGDVSFVPQGYLRWINNAGEEPLHMILITSHEEPETIELSQMLAGVPNENLAAIFGIDKSVFDQIPENSKAVNLSNK